MMLHALRIALSMRLRNSDGSQERHNDGMARACSLRDSRSRWREFDGTVARLASDAASHHAPHDFYDRDMRNPHECRQIPHPACSALGANVLYSLGVVLKGLRRMVASGLGKPLTSWGGGCGLADCHGVSSILGYDVAVATSPRIYRLLARLLPALWLAGVSPLLAAGQIPAAPEHPLNIVATTGMLGDMVRGIVGDSAQVTTLMGEGVDPHLYKVTVSDVRALAAADVVVANGLMLEGRMSDVFGKLRHRGVVVIEAGAELDPTVLLHPDGAHGHPDPHIWMDPSIWSQCALHVARVLGETDPVHSVEYANNAKAMVERWKAADARIAAALATVPPERRVLVTAHDAFAYFGRRYSVEVMGIQGISTESESGLADIRRLIDLLVQRDVPAVFVETSVSDKNVLALVEGGAARGRTIKVGGSLFSDAMGKAGTFEGTYAGMVQTNAATIVMGLGGDASGLTGEGAK